MNRTDKVVAGTLGILLAYEAYTLMNDEEEDTISETIWRFSHRPLVPFIGGFLAAHFWFGPYGKVSRKIEAVVGK